MSKIRTINTVSSLPDHTTNFRRIIHLSTDDKVYIAGKNGWYDLGDVANFPGVEIGTGPNNVVQLDGNGKLPAVDGSQLTNLPAGSMTLTGDVTGSGAGTINTAIANDAVTFAKLQNIAQNSVVGRVSAGAGDPEELTGTQVTGLLDVFTASAKGLVPASGGGTQNFLRADGTWAQPSGGGAAVIYARVGNNTAVEVDNVNNLVSTTINGIAAGEQYIVEFWGRVINNSGATKTYTLRLSLGGQTLDIVASTTIANGTTSGLWARFVIAIVSTTTAFMQGEFDPMAATADGASGTVTQRKAWSVKSANLTGNQSFVIQLRTSATGVTQSGFLHGVTIQKVPTI